MASGALCLVVPPLDQGYPALGRVDPGPRGGCSGSAGREGALVPEGRQQRGDLGELHALPPMEAGGPPEWGRPAIPPAEGLVECGAPHRQALGDAIQGRQPPPGVRARVRPVEEASHEDVLQAEKAGGRPLEGVEGAGDGREGPLRALAARGQRAAHLGELAADGRCRVAPRHPAAHLLLRGQPAAAGERLHPAPAHPVRGRRREGTVRGVREGAAGHSACVLRCAEQEGRRHTSRWGGGGVPRSHVRVHDCGRALPEHPSGVAVPLGPASGRAGPGQPTGGGASSSRPRVLTAALRSLSPVPTLLCVAASHAAHCHVPRAPAGPSALRPVLWAQPPPPLPCIRLGARAGL